MNMFRLPLVSLLSLMLVGILAFGCNKNHDEARASGAPSSDALVVGEFTTLDAASWVNGAPISLDAARGKQVVLIEAWHPA